MMLAFSSGGVPTYIQSNYFHFHFTPNLPISLAFAPMIRFLVAGGGGSPVLWPGMRLGVEFNSPFKRFLLGIYARPALAVQSAGGVTAYAFDGVIELTFTWYGVTGGKGKSSNKPEE